MATIKPTVTDVSGSGDGSALLVVWSPLTEADVCQAVQFPKHSDKSIHVSGTFGGATVTVNGANNSFATAGIGLRDPSSTAISFTAEGLKTILENTQQVKPIAAGGAGQSLTISILFHFSNPARQ